MAYSKIGVINLALGKIGVAKISSVDEDSAQGNAARVVWDYILDEVLQARDWVFAKVRTSLAQSTTSPVFRWGYAYPMPQDFLRIAKGSKDDPPVYMSSDSETVVPALNYSYLAQSGTVLTYPWVIETLADGTVCLMTDFDNSDGGSVYMTYIRRVSDPSKWSPAFVSALSLRLAAELAMQLTESQNKFQVMMQLYEQALRNAAGQNQALDSQDNDLWNGDWEVAGRV